VKEKMSKISDLQGKLGGAALLAGMKPGARPPAKLVKKSDDEKSAAAEIDSAAIDKPALPAERRQRTRKDLSEIASEVVRDDEELTAEFGKSIVSPDDGTGDDGADPVEEKADFLPDEPPKTREEIVTADVEAKSEDSDVAETTASRPSIEGDAIDADAAAASDALPVPASKGSKTEPKSRKQLSSGLFPQITEPFSSGVAMVTKQFSTSADTLVYTADSAIEGLHQHTGLRVAPLSVPIERRRQTFAVLMQSTAGLWCLALNFWFIRYSTGAPFYFYLFYLAYKMFFQTFHRDGGLPIPWMRNASIWKWYSDFFPIRLHKSADLDPKRVYIFGYHPHGIISHGAWGTFAIQTSGFPELFPGVSPRACTLRINFMIPFWDLLLTWVGMVDASRESIEACLNLGDSVCLVIGGAKESLDAHSSSKAVPLFLKKRKGFVKVALENGAALVPVFGFGENDLYHQIYNPKGSWLRNFQDKLQQKMGFALPLFSGRGIFLYDWGFLPKRVPINVVFGEPIQCPKLPRSEISLEILSEYHDRYMAALKKVFDEYKGRFYKSKDPPEMVFV
jgi:2-acylglycerol O-acyltransferase 2